MKLRDLALALGVAGAAMLIYGALVESNRLVLERKRLALKGWPKSLNGTTIALLADLHVRDFYSARHAQRAVELAISADPDFILFPGDLVAYWKDDSIDWLRVALLPLTAANIPVIVSMGNHEYDRGTPEPLEALCEELGFKVLRNEAWRCKGVTFAGVDSANAVRSEPKVAMAAAKKLGGPIIVLWHEPDVVDLLPLGAALMVSGHTHGGQFTFPGGFTPMHTSNGRKYVKGFFPDAPTPLYVSRGIGTTGPPSRLNCSPEVSLLELTGPEPRG